MKLYPLSVWQYAGCWYASKGHHDPEVFRQHLREDWGVRGNITVSHGYARLGFDGEGGMALFPTHGPGRGVFPITEADFTLEK